MKFLEQQKGSSLLYVILLLGIMLIISFSMAVLSVSELQSTGVNQRSQKAFYLAEAGIERSLYELSLDPSATYKSTQPVQVNAAGDSYQYCYGMCAGGQAPSVDALTYTLEANTARKVYLFDPTNLQNGAYTQSGETVTFQCTSCSSNDSPKSGLEVTLYSFNPATVSSFNLTQLQNSNLNSTVNSLDESNINIETHYFGDMSLYNQNPTSPEISVESPGKLYMIQLHALQHGGTYVLKFNHPFNSQNTPTIQAIGEAKNVGFAGDARRAISLTYSTTKDALDIFNYALFEDTTIDKLAK